jgi:hypothetical protein
MTILEEIQAILKARHPTYRPTWKNKELSLMLGFLAVAPHFGRPFSVTSFMDQREQEPPDRVLLEFTRKFKWKVPKQHAIVAEYVNLFNKLPPDQWGDIPKFRSFLAKITAGIRR